MTARPLQAVLRALADTGPPDTDAELLRRFVATRDDEAFATLVKRHGRLVWAVCRHLTNSDAEADDAFQATFLVLVRSAASVKDAARLSAWLHGVAYKVCGKSRLSAKRRTAREQTIAVRERNGHSVPDSAWDRALAAVHEEVAGLPETLRVPFVLCCLEGVGQTEAAEQLGWKLGTLSGRLTRAKDAVLEKLSARGLTLGVLATVGTLAVPSEVSAKAVGLGLVGAVVPGSVLQLSTGVIGMSVNKVKLLAAGVLAACGLATTGGAGWVASVEAQTPPARAAAPADRVKQLEAELQRAKADAKKAEADAKYAEAKAKAKAETSADRLAEQPLIELEKSVAEKMAVVKKVRELAQAGAVSRLELEKYEGELAMAEAALAKAAKAPKEESAKPGKETATSTKRWEYDFVSVSEMAQAKFVRFLQEREDKGWEFIGTTPLSDNPVWVFRRSKGGMSMTMPSGQNLYYRGLKPLEAGQHDAFPHNPTIEPNTPAKPAPPAPPAPPVPPIAKVPTPAPPAPPLPPSVLFPAQNKQAEAAEELEAEIKRLQDKLESLKKSKPKIK